MIPQRKFIAEIPSAGDRADLVLQFASVLFVNGQSTERTLSSARELATDLGLAADVTARWGSLALQTRDGDTTMLRVTAADPTGVNMGRVVSAGLAIDSLGRGAIDPAAAREA